MIKGGLSPSKDIITLYIKMVSFQDFKNEYCISNKDLLDNVKPGKPKTNREHLEEELGDLQAMVEILQELDIVSFSNIERAAEAKREKLKIWSNIFKTENI